MHEYMYIVVHKILLGESVSQIPYLGRMED